MITMRFQNKYIIMTCKHDDEYIWWWWWLTWKKIKLQLKTRSFAYVRSKTERRSSSLQNIKDIAQPHSHFQTCKFAPNIIIVIIYIKCNSYDFHFMEDEHLHVNNNIPRVQQKKTTCDGLSNMHSRRTWKLINKNTTHKKLMYFKKLCCIFASKEMHK